MSRLTFSLLCFLVIIGVSGKETYPIEPYDKVKPKLKSEIKALNDALGKELLKDKCHGDVRRNDKGRKLSFQCGDTVSNGKSELFRPKVWYLDILFPRLVKMRLSVDGREKLTLNFGVEHFYYQSDRTNGFVSGTRVASFLAIALRCNSIQGVKSCYAKKKREEWGTHTTYCILWMRTHQKIH